MFQSLASETAFKICRLLVQAGEKWRVYRCYSDVCVFTAGEGRHRHPVPVFSQHTLVSSWISHKRLRGIAPSTFVSNSSRFWSPGLFVELNQTHPIQSSVLPSLVVLSPLHSFLPIGPLHMGFPGHLSQIYRMSCCPRIFRLISAKATENTKAFSSERLA